MQHKASIQHPADTDVYNIGLVMTHQNKHFVVKTNYNLYIDVEKLISRFQYDPDLASLPQANWGQSCSNDVLLLVVTTFWYGQSNYTEHHLQLKVDSRHASD